MTKLAVPILVTVRMMLSRGQGLGENTVVSGQYLDLGLNDQCEWLFDTLSFK